MVSQATITLGTLTVVRAEQLDRTVESIRGVSVYFLYGRVMVVIGKVSVNAPGRCE